MRTPMRAWFAACSLLLSGCLLPQPDTPIIPPPAMPGAESQRSAPAAAPQQEGLISNNGGEIISNDAGIQPAVGSGDLTVPKADTALASGTLSGRITGLTVTRVTAVPESGGEKVDLAVGADGRFSLELPAGAYFLDLAIGGETLRVDKRLQVHSGETRAITLTLQADPLKATLTEEASLVAPSPSPSPEAEAR